MASFVTSLSFVSGTGEVRVLNDMSCLSGLCAICLVCLVCVLLVLCVWVVFLSFLLLTQLVCCELGLSPDPTRGRDSTLKVGGGGGRA